MLVSYLSFKAKERNHCGTMKRSSSQFNKNNKEMYLLSLILRARAHTHTKFTEVRYKIVLQFVCDDNALLQMSPESIMGTDLSIWAKCEKWLEGISMNELMEISEHQIIMDGGKGTEHTIKLLCGCRHCLAQQDCSGECSFWYMSVIWDFFSHHHESKCSLLRSPPLIFFLGKYD